MPVISQSKKIGKSADSSDLLAERKRNLLIQDIQSKKALGIYKPNLNSRGFDSIRLQNQNGLDFYSIKPVSSVLPPVSSLISQPLQSLTLFGNLSEAHSATYGNGIWVICGQDKSGNGRNFWYGSDLTTLQSIPLFGNGGLAYSATYGNGTWVICGQDLSGNGGNLWYGTSDLSVIREHRKFGDGGVAYSATYANRIWVICGEDKTGNGYNLWYGSDLTNLQSIQLFGNGGVAYSATYNSSGYWVLCGKGVAGAKNVYITGNNDITNIQTLSTNYFDNGGYARSATYANRIWVICGRSVTSGSKGVFSGPLIGSLTQYSSPLLSPSNLAIYANGKWVICGNNDSGNGNTIFYGSDLTNLQSIQLFGNSGVANSVAYANNTWVFLGYDSSTNNRNKNIWYGPI